MKIGIPRSLYYYYFNELWLRLFKKLNIEVEVSPKTNKKIMEMGVNKSNDEMCLSLKNYIGHICSLKHCDYILVPRIDNYGRCNQTCTNFLATYDIINNLFENKILNYNIDLEKGQVEEKEMYKMLKKLGVRKNEYKKAYKETLKEIEELKNKKIKENVKKLNSNKIKILIVGHPYNVYDELMGKKVIDYLKKQDVEIIYSDLFDSDYANLKSKNLSYDLYFKYNKENIGSIEICKNKIDGIIFISAFPCGPDSLVNELVIRKIKELHINLVIDDQSSNEAIITRLESFIDILEAKRCIK